MSPPTCRCALDRAQPWCKCLDRDRVDLGTGNRTLAPKGRLDPTYRITYPRGLDASS